MGVVNDAIASDSSGTVSLWKIDSGSEADALVSVTAYDWLGRGIASAARVLVFQHPQSRRWYVLPGDEPCGDLLAGWDPHSVDDADEKNCAGSADVTLLSSDPFDPPTPNVTERGLGYIGRNSWKLVDGATRATLWVNDTPDFISLTKDFTVRILWNMSDTAYTTNKYIIDFRLAVTVRIHTDTSVQKLIVDLFDGSTTEFTFAGISDFSDDAWYVAYLRWKQSTRVMTVNAMDVDSDLEVTTNEDITAMTNDLDISGGTNGIFVGNKSDGSASGMRGLIDGLLVWQRRLEDCEMGSDYNCGELRTLPTANKFFSGPGGFHRKPRYISSSTEPTL